MYITQKYNPKERKNERKKEAIFLKTGKKKKRKRKKRGKNKEEGTKINLD